jgi:hypothetical protein
MTTSVFAEALFAICQDSSNLPNVPRPLAKRAFDVDETDLKDFSR